MKKKTSKRHTSTIYLNIVYLKWVTEPVSKGIWQIFKSEKIILNRQWVQRNWKDNDWNVVGFMHCYHTIQKLLFLNNCLDKRTFSFSFSSSSFKRKIIFIIMCHFLSCQTLTHLLLHIYFHQWSQTNDTSVLYALSNDRSAGELHCCLSLCINKESFQRPAEEWEILWDKMFRN